MTSLTYLMGSTEYREQIQQLLSSVDVANILLALHILEGVPALKGELLVLESLDLSNQQLAALPPMLFECANLEELNLAKNQISTVPADIQKLKKLTRLDLSHNQLKNLPNEISKLALKELDLRHNLLEEVPKELGTIFSNNMNTAKLYMMGNSTFELENIAQTPYLQKTLVRLFAVYTTDLDLPMPRFLKTRLFWRAYFKTLGLISGFALPFFLLLFAILRIFLNTFWSVLISGGLWLILELFCVIVFYLMIRQDVKEALSD
ncbi:hypothetical protein BKI52_10340 [marine bacterium AO1-C]|nr:hypothetical protein BKI52_10340 [marine bacterium AO1-C]